MTLSELKRKITLGTKIKKVDCGHEKYKPETIGKIRTVDRVQTNAFTMDGSWMYWQKASDYEIGENWFSVYWEGQPHIHENLIGKYEFV